MVYVGMRNPKDREDLIAYLLIEHYSNIRKIFNIIVINLIIKNRSNQMNNESFLGMLAESPFAGLRNT